MRTSCSPCASRLQVLSHEAPGTPDQSPAISHESPVTKVGTMGTYKDFHRRSIERKDEFWSEQARLVDWHGPCERVLDYSGPAFARWFVGGYTNLCHNAVDRHLSQRGGQKALIYISTETGQERSYTYRELHAETNRCAGMIR